MRIQIQFSYNIIIMSISEQSQNQNSKSQKEIPINYFQQFPTSVCSSLEKKPNQEFIKYQSFNTVINGFEKDFEFIQSIQNLSKISLNQLNLLIDQNVVITNIKCQQFALQAESHRDAQRPCHFDILNKHKLNQEEQKQYQLNKCKCGCERVKGNQIPLSIDESNMAFLGSGIVLFFLFIRMMIVLTGIGVVLLGFFGIIMNYQGNQGQYSKCDQSSYCLFKIKSSLQNNKSNLNFVIAWQWIGVLMVFLWIIILRISKYKGAILETKVDQGILTPSDTALKIENLPYGQSDEEEILNILNDKWNKRELQIHQQHHPLQIKSIQIVYNMKRVRDLVDQIQKKSIELSGHIKFKKNENYGKIKKITQQKYRKLKESLIEKVQLMSDLKKKFYSEVNYRRKIATTCAIVEFSTQKSKTQFLKYFGNKYRGILDSLVQYIKQLITTYIYACSFCAPNQRKIYCKGRLLTIQRAPEPEDILWQNCQIQYNWMRILFIYIISIIIIIISLGIVIGFSYLQTSLTQNQIKDSNTITFINYLISFSLMIINQVLSMTLIILIKYEYNHTNSQQVISQTNKTVITQALNSILIPLISNILIQQQLFGPNGVSGTALDFSFSNTLVFILMLYLDPNYYIKKIIIEIKCLRNIIIRYYARAVSNCLQNEYLKQLNKFYESPDIDMTESYIYLTVVILHSSFYCILQPFVLFLAFIGFLLFYYMKKYLLLRRYSAPKMLQKLVFDIILIAVSTAPLFFGIGNLIFMLKIYEFDAKLAPCIIIIIISVVNLLNPKGILDRAVIQFYNWYQKKTTNTMKIKDQTTIQTQGNLNIQIKNQKFQYNNSYYYNNHIATLFGYKRILQGKDINSQIREQIKDFVESFGIQNYYTFDYPLNQEKSSIEMKSIQLR